MRDSTPILPAHIEDTVRAIAELHARHRRNASPVERTVRRAIRLIGRPAAAGALTAFVIAWVGLNLMLQTTGGRAFDPPPFSLLQDNGSLLAIYLTMFILITQRRDDQLSEAREQLTLELAILNEQKSAKIIALLEEMRRDSPVIPNRHDPEAQSMAVPADPQAVLEAIKETQGEEDEGNGEAVAAATPGVM